MPGPGEDCNNNGIPDACETGLGPTIDVHPVSVTTCEGTIATFTVQASGWAPLEYQWRKDGVDIPGAIDASYTIDPVLAGDAGVYDVVVTNACGTVTSDPATLTIETGGPTISSHPQSQSTCVGGVAAFSVVATGPVPLEYQWRKDSSPIGGATAATVTIDPVVAGDAGAYDVIVTSPCGSATSNTATLTITPDTTPPVITCPAGLTIECGDSTDPSNTGAATAVDDCDPAPTIVFNDVTAGTCPSVITRTWTATDASGHASMCVQMIVVQDTIAPVFGFCTSPVVDVTIPAGGACEVFVDVAAMVAATDACDPAPTLDCAREDSLACTSPFPCGTTTVTWTATDQCGNASFCIQTVTVNAWTELAVTVELQGVYAASIDRCITFELHVCDPLASFCGPAEPHVVDQAMSFTSPGVPTSAVGSAILQVPCGQYSCVTARDKLHTLRRTISPIPDNTSQYPVGFTAAGGKYLLSGNLNDDCWIDIVDFGLLAGVWNTSTSANTNCSVTFPPAHGDFTGNGLVWSEDYTFVQLNMWEFGELNCCGVTPLCGGRAVPSGSPIERISVPDLHRIGLAEAAVADLNDDGWLDMGDIALWMHGVRPDRRSRKRAVRASFGRSRASREAAP